MGNESLLMGLKAFSEENQLQIEVLKTRGSFCKAHSYDGASYEKCYKQPITWD